MEFYLITNNTGIAAHAINCGVDKIFIDLEYIGKNERQKHLSSWKSKHKIEDINIVRDALPNAYIIVRINPMHEFTKNECEDVISRGADAIMLPMFRNENEIENFYEILSGRVDGLPLFETASSVRAIPELIKVLPIKKLHIGLNDLHIDLGMKFLFEPLSKGFLEEPCAALKDKKIPFGIGGIARVNEGLIDPSYIIGEYVRLGASSTILSQSFHGMAEDYTQFTQNIDLVHELKLLRDLYTKFLLQDRSNLEKNRKLLYSKINELLH